MRRFAVFAMACVVLSAVPWRDDFGADRTFRPFPAAVARGALIVAVPSRPAPTLNVGHVDHFARAPEAFAAALAEDIGRRAGLRVVLLPVDERDETSQSDARNPGAAREALRSGRADIAIAGLAFGADRALSYAPSAYTSGRGMALVLRHGKARAWRELEGASICVARGSPFARDAARRTHASVLDYDRPLDALLAFQAGECAALVDDEQVIRKLLKQADWSYYRTLPGTLVAAPAFIATRGGDIAGALFIEDVVRDWRRQRWLATVREDQATQLAFDMFNAQNDLYCH